MWVSNRKGGVFMYHEQDIDKEKLRLIHLYEDTIKVVIGNYRWIVSPNLSYTLHPRFLKPPFIDEPVVPAVADKWYGEYRLYMEIRPHGVYLYVPETEEALREVINGIDTESVRLWCIGNAGRAWRVYLVDDVESIDLLPLEDHIYADLILKIFSNRRSE